MAGNGYNQLPRPTATYYTGETPPPVHITGYRCSGPSLYGSGSLNREFLHLLAGTNFTAPGVPGKRPKMF